MNIGMVLGAPFPADIRVSKEAGSLIKAGHSVHLLCTKTNGQPEKAEFEGIKLTRISGLSSFFQNGVWDVINAISFVHPLFYAAIGKFITENKIEVLHVHDLPLAKTALILGKKHNIPVIMDMHENYPEAIKVWFEWKKNPLIVLKNKIFFSYQRWFDYEKYVTQQADHIIAVVDEMKQRLIEAHNADPEKITVVTNSEYKSFKDGPVFPDVYGPDAGKFIIAYTGNVGPHRGVDTVIEAMQFLKGEPIQFAIVGRVNKAVEARLVKAITELDLHDQVKLYGYQPYNKFLSFMTQANVNIIPHHSNLHTDNTVPHKIFQCMQVKRPLLVSSSAPIKRIAEETRSGLVFEAGNPKSLAEKIKVLQQDEALCRQLAENGYKATQEGPYNWETTELTLQRLYQSFKK